MRAGPVARWLVAVFLVFGVGTGVAVELVDDDERPAAPALVISETIDPVAFDDLAVDKLTSDPGKAALPPTAALALGASTLGVLLMRAARHPAAGWPGASPTRGPPRVLSARSNSLPTAPSHPLQRSIKGRGPPARRLSRACRACCSTDRSPTQEERS